jgi:hypothetical protein
MTMEEKTNGAHLTDPELFTLAVPPVGEPEALPRHLSECLACSRALQEWKSAVREAAQEEIEPLERRSEAEWERLEEETIAAMRRAGHRGRRSAVKWVVSAAAAALLAVLLLPAIGRYRSDPRPAETVTAQLSAQDQNDDALLRDVDRLSRGEDGAPWNGLAPEPGSAGVEEERL